MDEGWAFRRCCDRARLLGSFLKAELLPPAQDGSNVFYVCYIFHDWPPAESELILRNIRKAIRSKKATLLIGECALPGPTLCTKSTSRC